MYGFGPGKVDLHGACLLGLAYSKIDLSLLQRQSASQEKHGRLQNFQHQSTGCLRTRGQEALYETLRCMCIIDLSLLHLLRDSEPPLNGYPSTKGHVQDSRLRVRETCAVSFTLINTHCLH